MGEEKKESYSSKGVIPIEINTSEGVFKKDFNVEADFDEIPF